MRLDKAVENWHPVICEDIIRLRGLSLMIVARKDPDIHSRLFQSGDCPSRGSGKTVSGSIKIIDNKEDFHLLILEFKLVHIEGTAASSGKELAVSARSGGNVYVGRSPVISIFDRNRHNHWLLS